MSNKTQAILEAIQNRLEFIAPENGFTTSLGANVRYWQTWNVEIRTTGVTFRDASEQIIEVGEFFDRTLEVELDAIAYGDDLLPLGCAVVNDLINAVGLDPTWGGLALYTVISEEGIAKDGAGSGVRAINATVPIKIVYRSPKWQI